MTEGKPTRRIVVIGGYGVFGGKLAVSLLRDNRFEVVIAGRNIEKAKAFCAMHGGHPSRIDRSAPDFATTLAALTPFVTVDAAGPFQSYGKKTYAVAKAALLCGSHYLDLSDDSKFTSGISVLNETAIVAGKTALSGVSSVPALSSAAVEGLRENFLRLDLIESAILPGNQAPRGLSVIRAILAQTGQPLSIFRDGSPDTVIGWSGLARRRLGPHDKTDLPPRWTSFIGAPDLALFPERYQARTVLFRAGLELPVMHLGLWCLSWLTRLRLIRSLEPCAKILLKIADWLKSFGSDRGGMEVRLAGLDREGAPLACRWTLIAQAGDGPYIPAVAAAVLCRRLSENSVASGARPCLGEFTLDDVTVATSHLKVRTFIDAETKPTLFQRALGPAFGDLPVAVQSLHTVFDRHLWCGEARVTRGKNMLGKLLCRIIGFPPQADKIPVSVTIDRRGDLEVWRRDFGGKVFKSVLSLSGIPGEGVVRERFGLTAFDINLQHKDGALTYPVKRGSVLGIPLPRWLLPVSETREYTERDRFHFDVRVSLPGLGDLIHYAGWLEPNHSAVQR